MEYISVKEASKEWNVSERRIRAMCQKGMVEGAFQKDGWSWNIPRGLPKPSDGRTTRFLGNKNLRTGVQDYSALNKIRKSSRTALLTDMQKAQIISNALSYDGITVTRKQILDMFRLKKQDLPLELQMVIVNTKYAFDKITEPLTSGSILEINGRILSSIVPDGSPLLREKSSMTGLDCLIRDYSGTWSALHPAARISFLFSEMIRLALLSRQNTLTAFVTLNALMVKHKMPPVVFSEEEMSELKAALASSQINGNNSRLVGMILDASTRRQDPRNV